MNILQSDPTLAWPSAEILHINGPDAATFLHNQLSSSVHELLPGQWQWSAWLNVQGRVRALLQLGHGPAGHYHAWLRGGRAVQLSQALQPFIMRAKIALRTSSQGAVPDDALPTGKFAAHGDELVFGMGSHSWRLVARNLPSTSTKENLQRVRLEEIHRGWPYIPDNFLNVLLPPALGLEHLTAVRFDKGCFPGQEVAARLHFRGGHKYRLAHLCSANPIRPGQTLEAAHVAPLKILNGAASKRGFEMLAVVHQDFESSTLGAGIELLERFAS